MARLTITLNQKSALVELSLGIYDLPENPRVDVRTATKSMVSSINVVTVVWSL